MKYADQTMENPYYKGFEDHFFKTSDGVNIHYINKGNGVPLIMIPGFSDSANAFTLNAPQLSEHYAVYILEMRGHGYSENPGHGARLARLSADLHEFINYLDVEKVNFLGFSMGCSVFWSYIDLFGEKKINKCIFIDQAPFLSNNPQASEEENLRGGGVDIDIWDFVNKIKAGDNKVFAVYFKRGKRYFNREIISIINSIPPPQRDAARVAFLGDLLRDHLNQDWRDVFSRISVPSLLISGDISHATTFECCQWMLSQMKNCKWLRYTKDEGGTHTMFQNSYQRFNSEVIEFLR